ncbi:MAG: DUF167 domain-containing protein, partial [Patescibacteria group bacterium]
KCRYNKGVKIQIKVIPNAKTSNVPGKRAVEEKDGVLVVRVKAVPEKGKANEAVIKILAKHFKVAKSEVKIVRGFTGRNKVVEIG